MSFANLKWKLRFIIIVLSVCIQTNGVLAADRVRIWQDNLVLPTYRKNPDDVNPVFRRPLSYQGASRIIYPYPVQDNFANVKEDVSYKALYLENEYIKLCLLPEIGGRLFYATDKTSGYEIFYRQHVIKPAHIGMLGAWISGGIEWCVFHHHRASTFMPVSYLLVENTDGSKSIWFGEIEPRHRMKWSIGITLFPGKSYIKADVRLYNRTDTVNSFLYWANAAVHVNEDYQIFFPPSTKYGVYHAKNDFVHWPIGRGQYRNVNYEGVDVSWWKNHPRPISIFAHEIEEGFLAGYDHGKQCGTVHVANHHIVRGAKLWEWSPGEEGRIWDCNVLTDSDGPYAELMTGAYSDNQPDYSWIKPYEHKQASQYWYPLQNIGGVKSANLSAAVNLEVKKDRDVFFGFNTTDKHKNAKVRLTAKGKQLFEKVTDIGPAQPFVQTVKMGEGIEETDLECSLTTKSGDKLISYRPLALDVSDELPETVKPPANPADIKTNEQLYLTGLRIKQFHNARLKANDYFEEALRRDPCDARCNIQLGLDAAGRGLYQQAEDRFATAIKRMAEDYTRPRDCEAYYQLGLVLKKQGRLDEAYGNLYRAVWDYTFRSAAYYQLAEIACRKGRFDEGLDLIDNSLQTNAVNTRALGIKSAILRRLGRYEEALKTAKSILEIDPLDFLARNEAKLALVAMHRKKQARQQSEKLNKIMQDNEQSYLELAADYMNCGLNTEAIDLLTSAVEKKTERISSFPIIHYYLAYLYHKNNDQQKSNQFLASATRCPTDYCFPFRLETVDVLDYAISSNADDGRAYYYLGNVFYDRQAERAMAAWKKAIECEPSLAIAHRNLGWGYYYAMDDIAKAIESYQNAIKHNPQDPRYYYELDILHERNGTNIEKRLRVLEANHEVLTKHNLAVVREIIALVQGGRYDKAIGFLSSNVFSAQEANRRLHDIYVDAHLLRGLAYYNKGRYGLAVADFLAADQYPENHQVGRDKKYIRNAQIYHLTGLCYQALGENGDAEKFFKMASQQQPQDSEYLYYKALALQKLGQAEKASCIFDRLIRLGKAKLSKADETDFFSKFGEGKLPHLRKASAHYMTALGYMGKHEKSQAESELKKAVDLDINHIWAGYYLQHLDEKKQAGVEIIGGCCGTSPAHIKAVANRLKK